MSLTSSYDVILREVLTRTYRVDGSSPEDAENTALSYAEDKDDTAVVVEERELEVLESYPAEDTEARPRQFELPQLYESE